MKKLIQSKKHGSAILLALVVVLILLAMGTGLLRLGLNSRIFSIRTASDIAARCAADAGLTMALFRMNEKLQVKPWNDSTLPEAIDTNLPYCDAVFSYTVTGDLTSGYIISSVGRADQAQEEVSATIRLQGLFEFSILTKETLILKSGARGRIQLPGPIRFRCRGQYWYAKHFRGEHNYQKWCNSGGRRCCGRRR